MTIFLENREEQIGGEGTWLIGSGSTEFACKAYFAWNRVDCHVRCTIPVKGGPITPLKQWRGCVRISRFRKLTAVRFDANKNAATIQRTADGSFSSNCWPVTISFNDYSPAVSYVLAYPRFIYIEQFTNSLFFFFSPPPTYFYDKPPPQCSRENKPNRRQKTNRVNFQQRDKNNIGRGEKKGKKTKKNKEEESVREKRGGRKKSEIQREKGVNEGREEAESSSRAKKVEEKKSGRRRQRHSTKCHFHRVGHRSSDAQRVR